MPPVDVFKDFLSAELFEGNNGEIEKALKELETLLGDPTVSHQRILYLESLTDSIEEDDGSMPKIGNPLSKEQHVACVEKGLLKAIDDEDVKLEQLMRLAHSVEGLRSFTSALLEVSLDQHASCWGDALEVPFDLTDIKFQETIPERPTELIWDQISRIANEWLDAITPRRKAPVLGFRDATIEKTRSGFIQDGVIDNPEVIKGQLDKLQIICEELKDREISKILMRMPWAGIGEAIVGGITWGGFLSGTGRILNRELAQTDIERVIEWLGGSEPNDILNVSEIKFIELLINCAGLPSE
jgi:hypothetical protein